jgi:hypothetical protein
MERFYSVEPPVKREQPSALGILDFAGVKRAMAQAA